MEVYLNQMNYHILLDFGKKNQYRYLSLIVLALLELAVVSDSFAQEDQSIVLTTSKNSYLPGDIVQLNGVVSGQPSPLVAVQIKDSAGNLILIRTVQTDQNGNFAIQFKIPSTATSGKFSIIASARVNGFVVTQTKVIDATVPEFPFVYVMLAISMSTFIIFYRLKFKS